MRTLAICGSSLPGLAPANRTFSQVAIGGFGVLAGILEIPPPRFDPRDPRFARAVLVRVCAFSCNFRDRSPILRATAEMAPTEARSIGSEFVAEVVAVGSEVTSVVGGDRVMGDNHYPDGPISERGPGIPTNHASREYLVLPESTLIRVPRGMPDTTAAAFSLGAQTAYSMLRKLGVTAESRVLVTAASSNTSLFAIRAALKCRARVYAITSSEASIARLERLGTQRVFHLGPDGRNSVDRADLARFAAQIGGFDRVVDPFADAYFLKVLPLMAKGARYATCGILDQGFRPLNGDPREPAPPISDLLAETISRNLHLVFNCLGLRDDLARAINDYSTGTFDVSIDSVHANGHVGEFLHRSYEAKDRFGKVVYSYQ